MQHRPNPGLAAAAVCMRPGFLVLFFSIGLATAVGGCAGGDPPDGLDAPNGLENPDGRAIASAVPADLPADVPADLPADLPAELPADLPADFPADSPADVAVAWNARILDVAEAEDGFLTLKGVRSTALVHLAMHDALAAMSPRYEPFVRGAATIRGDRGADDWRADHQGADVRGAGDWIAGDRIAAVNAAAYAIARSQYPDRDDVLKAERMRWTGGQGDERHGEARGEGDEGRRETGGKGDERRRAAEGVGERAAAAVLAARGGDGWDAEAAYRWHPMGPGVYAEFEEHSGTPQGFVFGAGWAAASPFALASADQFRSPPPPDIDSDTYARAFDEVREFGRRESRSRTADQTHLAMWWKEFVEKSHNRLARELIEAEGLGLAEAVRLLARLNMAVFDGYVASFDSKFHYNHWRPYTAIRWASNDGNPATREEPEWTNLHDHTYAFPSYPSAHGTVCAAAMTVMESVFGRDRAFVMTIREVDSAGPGSPKVSNEPPTRSFRSFAHAAEECSESRVYLGIHFRYDSEAGTVLGRRVGEAVLGGVLGRRVGEAVLGGMLGRRVGEAVLGGMLGDRDEGIEGSPGIQPRDGS